MLYCVAPPGLLYYLWSSRGGACIQPQYAVLAQSALSHAYSIRNGGVAIGPARALTSRKCMRYVGQCPRACALVH